MLFDSARWPNAVTIGKLIDRTMLLEAHCHCCGRCVVLDPRKLPLPSEGVASRPRRPLPVRALRLSADERAAAFEEVWPLL
jgi:hypothetical protein